MYKIEKRIRVAFIRDSNGPNVDPCGTLTLTAIISGFTPFESTRYFVLEVTLINNFRKLKDIMTLYDHKGALAL